MRRLCFFLILTSLCPAFADAVMLKQVDTFQTGTANWQAGAALSIINGGGPLGLQDKYLRITSDGSTSPAGTLSARNLSQWTGNYTAAGVTAIQADLLNLGATTLEIRALVTASNYGDFTSTQAYVLPADGQWHQATFGLTATDLTWGGSATGDLSNALKYIEELVLRHQSGQPLGRASTTPIASSLGVDNVRAIPEPGTLLAVAWGALLLVCGRFHRSVAVTSDDNGDEDDG